MAIWRTTAAGAVIAAVLACGLPVAAQVSPQVQQDMIQLRMVEAVKAEDYVAYLTHLAEFRRAGGRPDADMRFYEAVAHEAGGDDLAARDAIADFIQRAGRNHPRYTEALALLSRVEPSAKRAEARVAGMDVLLRALERGQSAVALTPLPPPSQWTNYRTFPSYGFFTSELHRGQEPMPDGGWMTFGHKPEGQTRNALPGLSDPRFPQAMLERRDAAGRTLWTRVYDWTQTAVFYELPKQTSPSGVTVGISPTVGPGRVQGYGPGGWGTVGEDPSARPQVGDLVTHVDGRAIGAQENVYELIQNAGPTARLTLQRSGLAKPVEVEIRRDTTRPSFHWLRREARGPVEIARAHIGGTWPPSPTPVSGQRDSWSSEIVAYVPDADGEGGRICANIDFGVFWDSHTQLGFWTRVKADGALEDPFVRAMPMDHPDEPAERVDTWYDNGLIDCAGLPDGSLLTVGRGVRWERQDGVRRGMAADRGTFFYRLFDADGSLLSTHRVPGNGAKVPWPAVEVRPRLRPVEGTGGWVWQNDGRIVDARDGQIRVENASQETRIVDWVYSDDSWYRIGTFGARTRLLGDQSGSFYSVQAAERLADGTVVALVNLLIADENLDMRAPDGGLIGVEVAPEGAAAGEFRDVGFLLGLDPKGDDEPLWAVRLRHNRPYPGVPHSFPIYPPYAEQADNGTYAVSTFWNDLVVLEDDTIVVTTLSGAGVRVRPDGR
ncbi:MAG: hypothetical protein WD341_17385 [Tistlia sp.]|uniref:hypothetical protein n=1 Tax=Tistlia sp. TaxID=3057121 RepID=UPI0034A3B312